MSLRWPAKDPDEVLDYEVDWTDRLAGDTIATATWTFPAGITKDSQSETDTAARVWISGGTLGEDYEILCRITTAGGRTMDQTVKIKLKAK